MEELFNKRVFLHETLHAITGAVNCAIKFLRNTGFLEGATESLVEDVYGDKKSSVAPNVSYNLSEDCTYKAPVSIIRQMEIILGKKSYDLVLKGDKSFLEEFRDRYGKDTFRYINAKANRLANPKFEEKEEEYVEYFSETQDRLLELVFDREMQEIKTIDDAKAYFDKLRKLGEVRGNVYGNDYYKDYYTEALHAVCENLRVHDFEQNEIDNLSVQYEYKEPEFFEDEPEIETYDEVKTEFQRIVVNQILSECSRTGELKFENFRTFLGKDEKQAYNLLLRNDDLYLLNTSDFIPGNLTWTRLDKEQKEWKAGVLSCEKQEDGYYITTEDGNEIKLSETEISQEMKDHIYKVRERILAGRDNQQLSEIKSVAQKQRMSKVQSFMAKIKNLVFGRENKEEKKEYSGEGK